MANRKPKPDEYCWATVITADHAGFRRCDAPAVEQRYDGLGLCRKHADEEEARIVRDHRALVWAIERYLAMSRGDTSGLA